jgi:hypothetical protein
LRMNEQRFGRSLAVLLFELATGTDLFPKDINRDNMINEADRQVISFVSSDYANCCRYAGVGKLDCDQPKAAGVSVQASTWHHSVAQTFDTGSDCSVSMRQFCCILYLTSQPP